MRGFEGGLACAVQRMRNELPPAARSFGAAPAVDAGGPGLLRPGEKSCCCWALGSSRIGTAVQPPWVIVPSWPPAAAATFVNATEPKSARRTVRHPDALHATGASAIHSADVRSGELTGNRFE